MEIDSVLPAKRESCRLLVEQRIGAGVDDVALDMFGQDDAADVATRASTLTWSGV